MSFPSHWNVTYAKDRLGLAFYSMLHPQAPWLAPDATRFLNQWLKPGHVGFEWGAGRSTRWFARRVRGLTSIEHDPNWAQRVRAKLQGEMAARVTLRCIPDESEYIDAISGKENSSLDFVLVDGVSALRDACARAALPKISVNGLLIVDDVHRYMPSESRSPLALPPDACALTPVWRDVFNALAGWEYRRMSSGVTDTGIWIRTAAS